MGTFEVADAGEVGDAGHPDLAETGVQNADKIPEALEAAGKAVEEGLP